MMRLTLLASVFCLAGAEGPAGDVAPDVAYERMRAVAGRDAGSQVKLALWCEANGLERRRLKHLAVAVLSDPSNALARGLMGLVEYRGKWRRPEAVAEALDADPARAALLADYNGRRVRAPLKADPQYELALWCERMGLKDEARAHLATVVRLDPARAEAWKKLGYKKAGKRWITEAEAAAEKAEADAQQAADRRWRPRLDHLRAALDGKGARRLEAERELATIADPRAVPAVWHAFVVRGGARQATAVQLLGQIDAIEASRALATLAVSAKAADVRRLATETLRRRDPREWADLLIVMLRDKIKYEVKEVGGPGSPGTLYVEGKKANVKRLYAPPPMPFVPFLPGDTMQTDANGLPVLVHNFYTYYSRPGTGGGQGMVAGNPLGFNNQLAFSQPIGAASTTYSPLPNDPAANRLRQILPAGVSNNPAMLGQLAASVDPNSQAQWGQAMRTQVVNETPGMRPDEVVGVATDEQVRIPVGRMMAETRRAAESAAAQLRGDVDAIEAANAGIVAGNERVGGVLKAATGVDLPLEPKPWRTWFVDQIGFRYKMTTTDEVPTVVENVPLAYQPMPVPIQVVQGANIEFVRYSCFGRGTPVRTIAGPRPIETLAVGDLVLTQDTRTGRLDYRPIVMVHHNPPSPTFKVALGDGGAIVTSPSHRFWKAGHGWVMARDLEVGDPIRTLGGSARVTSIEPEKVQLVFNLDIADAADFFAGDAAALVHDNTLPDLKLTPFDAPAGGPN